MLTVHLHLSGGDVIELEMSPSEKARVSRTINLERLPTQPFRVVIAGVCVEIPWRSIAYITARPHAQTAELTLVPAI